MFLGQGSRAKHGLAGRRAGLIGMAVLVGLLAGCLPSRMTGFGPVKSQVKTRTGFDVSWRLGAGDDAQIRERVSAMLGAELTADRAVRVALVNNRGLQAKLEQIGVGLAAVASATLPSNPELHANMREPLGGGERSFELQATQDLLDLITIPQRRSIAQAELSGDRQQAIGAVVDLIANVRSEFYGVQAAGQILELRQIVRDATAASYELARRLREAGNITELALAQERALHGEARLELARAELELKTTRERLNGLLGLSGGDIGWKVGARLPEVPKEAIETANLEAEAVKSNVSLATERQRMEAAAGRIGLARLRAWLPHLSAGVAAEREAEGGWTLGPALTLSIPLFDRKQGERARGHAMLRGAGHRHAALGTMLRAATRTARATLKLSRAQVLFLRDELQPVRQAVLEQTQLQYNAMNATPFELLSAKRARIATGVATIEAQRDYWQARVEVDRLRAGRLGKMRAPTAGGAPPASSGGH